MPNLTTNLGLKKPLESEFYDISVQNENLDIIDFNINQNETDIEALNTEITGAKSGIVGTLKQSLDEQYIKGTSAKPFSDIYISNVLNLGTSSVGTSGYSKLPNGMMLQWGIKTIPVTAAPNAQIDMSLPVAFPTACVHCSADNAKSGNAWYDLLATSVILDKTSIRLHCKNVVGTNLTGTLTCTWFAIGY